jgi:prophage regulatory protein
MEHASPARMISAREAAERTGLSRRTIFRLVDRGEFPRPHALTVKALRWPSSVIEAWLASKDPYKELV